MGSLGLKVSIISLNENGLNTSVKKERLEEWIEKHDWFICMISCLHFKHTWISRLKIKKIEIYYYGLNCIAPKFMLMS